MKLALVMLLIVGNIAFAQDQTPGKPGDPHGVKEQPTVVQEDACNAKLDGDRNKTLPDDKKTEEAPSIVNPGG